MTWLYKLIRIENNKYYYAYSRESKDLDGIIEYDAITRNAAVIQCCRADKGSSFCLDWALEHFWQVVKEDFPKERYICCG